MTSSAVHAFRQELQKNSGLRAKVQAISKRDKAAALKQLVGIAAAAGFKFSAEDARALIQPAPGRELSGKDLDKIAGGGEEGFVWSWGDDRPPQ
jgi:predicted ribosomally synthesized peptide with nif11-like leader